MGQVDTILYVLFIWLSAFYLGRLSMRKQVEIIYVDRMIPPESILYKTCGTCGAYLPTKDEE